MEWPSPIDTLCDTPHNCKRARYMSSWECSLLERDKLSPHRLGLVDLFGRRRRHARMVPTQSAKVNKADEEPFFTFRMEHREGGALAQHQGEERILVFRSDQRGAIAKIIFSSNPASSRGGGSALVYNETSERCGDEALQSMAEAKIHVLSVKEAYRGYDLGGLLFLEAMASLKHKYGVSGSVATADDHEVELDSMILQSVRCQLDAEEDIRRHNKLVNFYERLGCRVKPRAKISYLNNNDGETYRKVPMQIALRLKTNADQIIDGIMPVEFCSLVDRQGGFLPILFRESFGKRAKLSGGSKPCNSQVDWLVVETEDGFLEFHTTKGLILSVDPDGNCTAVADQKTCSDDWSRFQLFAVSDSKERDCGCHEAVDDDSTPNEARQKELWIFRSIHGSYLNLNRDTHSLHCSKDPVLWQADEHEFGLTCTYDTPSRRQHFRRMWFKQTVQYVRSMQTRYGTFGLQQMTIKKALDLIRAFPGNPFAMEISPLSPSLRTLCYLTAETARAAGFPDWVQFIGLVHCLGSVVNCIDPVTAIESDKDYDWTICGNSRVVGCAAPSDTAYGEFRVRNDDDEDVRFATLNGIYQPHCGFDHVLMTWTGPEYMYHMLKFNGVDIPDEGLHMLRYFTFYDWHTVNHYSSLANDDDVDMKSFVADFHEVWQNASRGLRESHDMSDAECEHLWITHYSHIVQKYDAHRLLKW